MSELARILSERHRQFLAFLEGRVESRAAAEEILQEAFVKSVEREAELRGEASAVAWFYRLLRNAVVDHYRRRGAEARALERERQLAEPDRVDPELQGVLCACIDALIPTLKAEYEQILRAVDLEGRPVVEVARELGISGNLAGVRLHRARQALRKRLEATCRTCATHGCLDCTCKHGSACE